MNRLFAVALIPLVATALLMHIDDPDYYQREIVCWGDSMTEGVGASPALIDTGYGIYDASNKSYPEILADFTGLRTYNFGVSGAESDEIAYMQGGIDSLEEEPGSSEEEEYAEEDQSPDDEQDAGDDGGSNSYIDEDVMQRGKDHLGDVIVLEIGSNGGWDESYSKLISQYRAMIEHARCKNYIIIGDTDDPGTSIADTRQKPFGDGDGSKETDWEKALEKEFGDHFINMRLYLVKNGLSDAGLAPTAQDEALASTGRISKQLRADWTHLNSYGYYSKAKAVFARGAKLGYWTIPFRPTTMLDASPSYSPDR